MIKKLFVALIFISSFSALATPRAEKGLRLFWDGALLVDLRTMQEHANGTIKGSLKIPIGTFKENLDKIPKHRDVVFFGTTADISE